MEPPELPDLYPGARDAVAFVERMTPEATWDTAR